MRVKIERNDHLNDQILRAVRLHAAADTRENSESFLLTPTQAVLVWWGMDRLERAVQDCARWANLYDQYADTLRCHADAVDWSRDFKQKLMAHAKTHNLEVATCR